MSFRKGDLFVLAVAVLGIGFASASLAGKVDAYEALAGACSEAYQWMSAPSKVDQLTAKLAASEACLAVAQSDLVSAREKLLIEEQRSSQAVQAADAKTSFVEAERDRLFQELAALKSRHSRLCQVLLELGNDVPSVLAAE